MDGSPLTRSQLIVEVQAALHGSGLDLSQYTGHSSRIGAATSAAQAGLSDLLHTRALEVISVSAPHQNTGKYIGVSLSSNLTSTTIMTGD